MQVGTTKDQGLYNKSSAAVHLGALAAGTLPQYNTIQSREKNLPDCERHPMKILMSEVTLIRKLKIRTFGCYTMRMGEPDIVSGK